jgi:hypothetical protein
MYRDQYGLVHNGFEDMTDQEVWDSLKKTESALTSGAVIFANPSWKDYAIECIQEVRKNKFVCAEDGSVSTRPSGPGLP